ncbi:hypothetical protein BJX66DRAFT_341956 [Aspergillus keveii]|uniref:C2H2-type domain-containing protein n=1 Tax=Aspergillus keveii TaxID=714993 RepID=A0ABR4FTQ6_9EURO
MTFKRSEHCARHQRGHTQEKPFPCRYCPKSYTRADVVVRHEKDLHWEQYVPRRLTSPHSRISTRASESSTDDAYTTPNSERRPTSPALNTPDASSILSARNWPADRPASPHIASYASSPSTRIQQAIAALDFTTLHAEALSLRYAGAPFPFLPPELESLSTGQTSSEMQPSTPCDEASILPISSSPPSESRTVPGEARSPPPFRRQDFVRDAPDTILVPDEDILTLGPVFDPLWDPVVTKTAAINGYVADLHRDMMIKAGLWGR